MTGRPTAEIIADLHREGSALRRYGPSIHANLHRECADRLAELEAMLTAAEFRSSRRLRTIRRYEAAEARP